MLLAKRGVTTTAAALSMAMTAYGGQTAPATLAAGILSAAVGPGAIGMTGA